MSCTSMSCSPRTSASSRTTRLWCLWMLVLSGVASAWRIGEAANPGPPGGAGLDDAEGSYGDISDEDLPVPDCWACGECGDDSMAAATRSVAAAETPSSDGPSPFSLDLSVGFSPAKRFHGAVAGWCFRLGKRGLGYYVDDKEAVVADFVADSAPQPLQLTLSYLLTASPVRDGSGAPPQCLLSLDELIPVLALQQPGRRRAVPRSKRQRQRKQRNGAGAPRPIESLLGESKGCTDHRAWGLWAFDTLNPNVASTGLTYLHDTGADVVFLQELRSAGLQLATTQRQAARAKWSLAAEPARLTDANAYSAGVGIAVRSHIGHAAAADEATFECCASRVVVTHMGAVCKGGIFLVSAYLWCSEGASARNLALLQAIGQRIRQLRGPWVMAADFNLPPGVLTGTGWLRLVQGAIISTGQATCKDAELDYFVVDKRLKDSVLGVARIHDTGSKPHSAARMWLKGNPRRDKVRTLVAPRKAEADIPAGCLPQAACEGWDSIADLSGTAAQSVYREPETETTGTKRYSTACFGGRTRSAKDILDSSFCQWLDRVEDSIADIHGWEGKDKTSFCVRSEGSKFVIKPALGLPGYNGRKLSAISVAWRTVAAWLTDMVQASSEQTSPQMRANALRAQWLLRVHSWDHLGEGVHAVAFRQWVSALVRGGWDDRLSLCWHRDTAVMVAGRAKDHDIRKSNLAWTKWLCDGPAKSLGRHHKLTRVATGWIPSASAAFEPITDSTGNFEGDSGEDAISEELIREADEVRHFPLSSQMEVDAAATAWGKEWLCGSPQPSLHWPDSATMEPLPPLTVDIMCDAAGTFPASTGLGWDKLHPKAVRRCGAAAVGALVRILVLAELVGGWPAAIGVTMICLLPKPEGGRRPIGLLPSVIRWWMRARLDIVRSWQAAHERPYFYAGPRKGAEVASWKQAARAELARASRFVDHATAMLDMVKAFERVPHQWLLRQGARYAYPLRVLRLSIAAYRLSRCITIDGCCSILMLAGRGITAGSVHATIELRMLLIEWLDDTFRMYKLLVLTVYVDDTSMESSGSLETVVKTVVGAVKYFTSALIGIGMEFSLTKNVILASRPAMANDILAQLPGLCFNVAGNAKSLGGALSNGSSRNAAVLAKRLAAFRVRKPHFQKLRRAVGARRQHAVLRSGGTAALMYGLGNTGVSDSTLLRQRQAVSAASVPGGRGDLDVTLMIADGSALGKADPAFAAHETPVTRWAEAVWESWLPRAALAALCRFADRTLPATGSPWRHVRGPACAFVATARRIGWTVTDYRTITTDDGLMLDLTRDSPALVRKAAGQAVRRWRWRRVELKHPHLVQGSGGFGAFLSPIYRLLNGRDTVGWGSEEKGALRSVLADRQWPQARLFQARLASSFNCELCVRAGLCDPLEPDPRFTGHLVHRILTCPATQEFRAANAPKWILETVAEATLDDGSVALDPADRLLLTRALLKSPEPAVDRPAAEDSFVWVKRADPEVAQVQAYVDGSRLHAEHDLHGLCARQGWAIAAYDSRDRLVAAAHGVTPRWAEGIHATELWGLLKGLQSFDPTCSFLIDCKAVQLGAQREQAWANAPSRVLARAWGPVAAALEGDKGRVGWMPAHNSLSGFAHKKRSDGQHLSRANVVGNDLVDELAKRAAAATAPPRRQLEFVRTEARRLTEAAVWAARATAFANRCPLSALVQVEPGAKQRVVRDSTALPAPRRRAKRRVLQGGLPTAVAAPRACTEAATLPAPVGLAAKRRFGSSRGPTATPVQLAAASRRAKVARLAARATAATDELWVAHWLAQRPAGRPLATTGAERLAALRARVAAKASACARV